MASDPTKASPVDYAPAPDPTQAQFRAVIRWGLTLSSVAMLAFAALTFFGVLPFPAWTAAIFVSVAVMDVVIAYVLFGPRLGDRRN